MKTIKLTFGILKHLECEKKKIKSDIECFC